MKEEAHFIDVLGHQQLAATRQALHASKVGSAHRVEHF
jgi:hypothetical protein